MVTALVLADTHLTASRLDRLPTSVEAAAAAADVVLHAGDVVGPELLEHLGRLAPVQAVCGNNDHDLVGMLPERVELDLGGVAVAMVHDSGPSAGRAGRLQRWFPLARVVVFGHSHIPICEQAGTGQLLLNPGSPTQRRRQPVATYAVLEVAGGEVLDARIHPV